MKIIRLKPFLMGTVMSLMGILTLLTSCDGDDGDNIEPKAGRVTTFTVKGVKFAMVTVEGGTFKMGNEEYDSSTSPVHQVRLSSFQIGQTEVTQELWETVMGSNPSRVQGLQLPVEQVSWNDCQTFIEKLNEFTGMHFRLPTEAEWEFAARGGTKSKDYIYSGSDNIDDVAWYMDNSDLMSHKVATKAPNELGIYDMCGNVWEWCQDWYDNYSSSFTNNPSGPATGIYRVLRGGSFTGSEYPVYSRGDAELPDYNGNSLKYSNIGLRLAM